MSDRELMNNGTPKFFKSAYRFVFGVIMVFFFVLFIHLILPMEWWWLERDRLNLLAGLSIFMTIVGGVLRLVIYTQLGE